MKKYSKLFIFILLVFTFTLTSCDSLQGIQGPQGPQGVQGEQGEPGKDGEDGHTPEITIGKNGNWYIDGQDTGVSAKGENGLQGPQGETGATGGTGIQGPQGEAGADGTSLLTGYGYPVDTLGKDGDSYIDLDSWDFYVKKNNSWNLEGNIKGNSDYEYVGTPGLAFYPLNDTECAVAAGNALYEKEIIIPEKYKQYTVTTIARSSSGIVSGFSDCTKLERIIIPNTVTDIMPDTFKNCYNLKEMVISGNLENMASLSDSNKFERLYFNGSIEDWLNKGWKTISSISASKPLKYDLYVLDEDGEVEVVGKKYSLVTEVTIPEGVESINSYIFANCKSITSVSIPDSIKRIGAYAFYGCSSLEFNNYKGGNYLGNQKNPYVAFVGVDSTEITSIEINSKTKIICDRTFSSCSNLEEVILPSTLVSIEEYAFYNCKKLSNINISSTLKHIGAYAFYNCDLLTSIILPTGFETIGDSAFQSCDKLSVVVISDTVKSIGNFAFNYCSELVTINFGNSLETIGDEAFANCSKLENFTLPSTLKEISRAAFSSCSSLTEVMIPSSVTKMGAQVFEYCSKLTIKCQASSRPSGWDSNWNQYGYNSSKYITVNWGQ